MIRFAFHAVAFAATLTAMAAESKAPFAGLGDDADKPIHISAETQQADFNAETVTYSGNVRIEQGELILRADTVMAEAPKAHLSRITATGDVIVTSRDATARAPTAVYEVVARTISLTGGVVLTQGGNTLKGTDLFVDLRAGTAVLTAEGGRVEGVFEPGTAPAQ